ncbi:MAG TPA: DUF4337 family protein [Candidatus Angelobacter sp.]|nr:DUF4337 family protein [Candidatus Angelobacter sp.]
MNPEEMKEVAEHAHNKGEKRIGLTMAIVAVLLAVATLLGHRAHTEEVKLQTKVNDGWGFYQAKHSRAHDYGKDAEKELVNGHRDLAARYLKVSTAEECGVPAEHNCASPVIKDSPILQQFVKESASSKTAEQGEGDKKAAEHAEEAPKGEGAPSREKKAAQSSHKDGAVDIQEHTRDLEKETDLASNQANFYDGAELFLEISIVLCSIALLAEMKLFWQLSFITTIIGIAVVVWGFVGVH